MTDEIRRTFEATIHELITKYDQWIHEKGEKGLKEISEANIRKDFVDPPFEALGWQVRDAHEYDAEKYVRPGHADVMIKLNEEPVMIIEAKRFRGIPERAFQQTINGISIRTDWYDEERQVLNYAYRTGVKWAILTNFEKFRVFNAFNGITVLNIEKPIEYIDRINEMLLLTKSSVESGQLDKIEERRELPDIDLGFLELLKDWRLKLARRIYELNVGKTVEIDGKQIVFSFDTEELMKKNLELIKSATQRLLDRLIIMRFAEDKLITEHPDLLKIINDNWIQTRGYRDINFLKNSLNDIFAGFYKKHNSKIFEKGHICEKLEIDNEVLSEIITALYGICFRKFTSDILGNTYESYLGHEFFFRGSTLDLRANLRLQKMGGIYYTPIDIVQFIVDYTLGIKLEKIWERTEELLGEGQHEEAIGFFIEVFDIKTLDAACGSGTFLIKVLELFEEYYRKFKEKIRGIRKLEQLDKISSYLKLPDGISNYTVAILKKSIYGNDLDPSASEITSVNLVLQSLEREKKLPLILYENIKIGNSLISGVTSEKDLDRFQNEIEKLTELREQLKEVEDVEEKKELEKEESTLREKIYSELNRNLKPYFDNLDDLMKPFVWEIEFPEIFSNGGFDVVIGNPPYFTIEGRREREQTIYYEYFKNFEVWKPYFRANSDIYYYFIIQAIRLLNKGGLFGFIIENYFLENDFADRLREFILKNTTVEKIIHFGDIKIFPTADNDTCILILKKEDNEKIRKENKIKVVRCKKTPELNENLIQQLQEMISKEFFEKKVQQERNKKLVEHIREHISKEEYSDDLIDVFWVQQNSLNENKWVLSIQEEIIDKIENVDFTLADCCYIGEGFKTGLNEAFIVDETTINKFGLESEILVPLLRNSHISRYYANYRDLHLIYATNETDIDAYENVKDYLDGFREKLENRFQFKDETCKWYSLSIPQSQELFDNASEKIFCPYRAERNTFAYDNEMHYGLTDTYIIVPIAEYEMDIRYLLALLNSQVLDFWYNHAGKAKGGMNEYFTTPLSRIPIREIDFTNPEDVSMHDELVKLVTQLIVLFKIKDWVRSTIKNLLTIFSMLKKESLDYYFNLNEPSWIERYGIELLKSKKIETNEEVLIKEYNVDLEDNYIIIKTKIDEEKIFREVLRLYFNNQHFRDYFYLNLIENEGKRNYKKKKPLYTTTLKDMVVRRYSESNLINDNVSTILNLMEVLNKEFRKEHDEIKIKLDLSKVKKEIAELQVKIDHLVYRLYDALTYEDSKIIKGELIE